MEAEEIRNISVGIINKLTEKYDKIDWFETNESVFFLMVSPNQMYHRIFIDKSEIWIQKVNEEEILRYKAVAENGEAIKLAQLWGKIYRKKQDSKDLRLKSIIQEIDKL